MKLLYLLPYHPRHSDELDICHFEKTLARRTDKHLSVYGNKYNGSEKLTHSIKTNGRYICQPDVVLMYQFSYITANSIPLYFPKKNNKTQRPWPLYDKIYSQIFP